MTHILIALPQQHPTIHSIQNLLRGEEPCSGTIGALIRGADLLVQQGNQVAVSGNISAGANGIEVLQHRDVRSADFDLILAHQSHWNEDALAFTFGHLALGQTRLWLQNQGRWRAVSSFWKSGGLSIICPTLFHANVYRAVPGFSNRVSVAYNTYCPVFTPDPTTRPRKGRLLFIGAITPTKGFREVMATWKELVARGLDLELQIAGSIALHRSVDLQAHSIGVADSEFETEEISPWLEALPIAYRPRFLGALNPIQLRAEILACEAVIVNPSWCSFETFCVAAVEAQVCARPVFSVARGGLCETVFPNGIQTLAQSPDIGPFADLIAAALSRSDQLHKSAEAASSWAQMTFSSQAIGSQWKTIIGGGISQPRLPRFGSSSRDLICDALRISHTAVPFERLLLKR